MSMLARYERGADNLRSSGTASAQPPGPQPKQRRAARKACEPVMSRAERGRDEVLEDGMAGSRAPKARELSVLPPGDGNADWLWIRDAVGRGGRFAFLARPVVAHCLPDERANRWRVLPSPHCDDIDLEHRTLM